MTETSSAAATELAEIDRAERGVLQLNRALGHALIELKAQRIMRDPGYLTESWHHNAYNRVHTHIYCACSVEQILTADPSSPGELLPCRERDATPIGFSDIHD